jgi:3-phosphoshikimate 1-carboxyvinyltransferase
MLDELLSIPNREFYDVGHAGTSFRFLTAFLAIREGTQILTGSDRMKERPIGPLVDALGQLSCQIEYLENSGYPPLKINAPKNLNEVNVIHVRADFSSQYITALMLIAPVLPKGLEIHLEGELVSESYLRMSLDILKYFGIRGRFENNIINIPHQEYQPKPFSIEADWSAASYYFALTALSIEADISLHGLFENSMQGDAELKNISMDLGVESEFRGDELRLSKGIAKSRFEYNFINQPDIAQTLAVICAAKNISATFSGLKTLKIKETDRIEALNNELSKIGSGFITNVENQSIYDSFSPKAGIKFSGNTPRFSTYKDHRMAMAFAPLALLHPIEIEYPEVVSKSYPGFWEDLMKLGFVINPVL